MVMINSVKTPSFLKVANAPAMELLEPRLIFDASFDMTIDRAPTDSKPTLDIIKPACDIPLPVEQLLTIDGLQSSPVEPRQEIVFIDAAVPDVANLLSTLSPTAEVHYLTATRDGALQIAEVLEGRTGIDAIHIVSHGREGSISLGTTQLTEASIVGQHRQALESIGSSLTPDGDILIYGCDVGATPRGFATVGALAQVTGADVAASDDLTGTASFGGDWDLEVRSGYIETTIIRAPEWDNILAPLLISVSGAPTVTGAGGAGTVGLWTNAGFLGTDAIDLRATVISVTGAAVVGLTLGTGDDPRVTITGLGSALIRWEVFKSGTSQTIIAIGDPNFLIRDLDGNGGVGASVEGAAADLTGLNSYTTNNPTNLILSNDGTQIRAEGTLGQAAADQAAWVKFSWLNRSTWEATYFCFNSTAGTRFYDHDGDGDFVFSNPAVVGLPQLDLDGNNSSGITGNNYATAYTENGTGIPVTDPDVVISHASSTTLTGATIKLTNAQAGDFLAAGSLPGGILASAYSPATGTITLSGTASLVDYQAALALITFASTSEAPSTLARNIEITVTDGVNNSDKAMTTIAVTVVNDPPIAVDDPITIAEDSSIVLDLVGNDTDADADTLSVKSINGVDLTPGTAQTILVMNGSVTVDGLGVITFTPAANYTGPATFDYVVQDPSGLNDTGTVNLTVTAVNDAPIIDLNSAGSSTDTDRNNAVTFTEGDAPAPVALIDAGVNHFAENDIQSITLYVFGNVDGAAEYLTVGGLIFNLDPVTGPVTQTITVGSTTVEIQTFIDLSGPFLVTTFVIKNTLGYTFPIESSDVNTLVRGVAYQNISNNPTPTTVSVIFLATDTSTSTSPYATSRITIVPVNDAPVAVNDTGTVTEDMVATGNVLTGLGADTDVDGGTLTVTEFSVVGISGSFTAGSPATISGVGTLVIAADGAWSFTPVSNYNGPIPVATYTVNDGNGGTDTATLTLTMTPVNDPPDAVDDTGIVTEDTVATGNLLTGLGADTDFEGDLLTVTEFTVLGLPGTFTAGSTATIVGVGTLVIAADGAWTFTPADNYEGPIPVATYTISDGNGGVDTATLTLSITPVNDAPEAANDVGTVIEDTVTTGNVLAGLGADTDADGDTLTVTQFTIAGLAGTFTAGATATIPGVGTLVIAANGDWTFTPDAHYTGPVPVATYTVSDGNGGTDTATLTLSITPANDAPQAANDVATVIEDTLTTGNVLTGLGSDIDIDGDTLSITQFTVAGLAGTFTAGSTASIPGVGTLMIAANGTWTFTPDTNYDGPVPVATYTVSDGNGGTDTATLSLSITPQNDTPVAAYDIAAGIEDTPVTGNVLVGSGIDTDVDGDTLTVTEFTITGVPGTFTAGSTAVVPDYGTLVIDTDGTWLFTPASNYFGDVPSLNANGPVPVAYYTISDGNGGTDTATLYVTITPVNDAPKAVNDTGTVTEDTVATGNVLLGLGEDTDVEGDTLTITQFAVTGLPGTFTAGTTATVPDVGTLVINADGTWIFTPASNYDGPVPVATYTVSDGNGGVDTATLSLTITPVNDTPVVIDPLNPGTALNPTSATDLLNIISDISTSDGLMPPVVNVADFIRDPEGQPLLYTAMGLPPGLILDLNTGVISGTLTAAASQGNTLGNPPGTYMVMITVTDPAGAAVVTTLTYTVANPAPLAANDSATVTEDIPAMGNILTGVSPAFSGNDSDPDGDTLSVTGFTVPGLAGTFLPGATATLPGIGALTILANGSYSFVPASNYDGPVPVIAYTISDGEGGVAGATLTLTILPVNDGPIVVDPANPGTALNPLIAPDPNAIVPPVASSDGLAPPALNLADYVRDPEGLPLTYAAVGLPPGLLLDPNTGVISGTLTAAASQGSTLGNPLGVYSAIITFTDSAGLTASTTLTYSIANPAPVAQSDIGVVAEDGPMASGNVLLGVGADADPDGDSLAVVDALWNGIPVVIGIPFTLPNGAVLTLNTDGTYSFDPKAAYNGLDSNESATEVFSYTITDGEGGVSTATLTLTIDGANDQPRLVDPANPSNLTPDPATLIPPQAGLDSGMIAIPTAAVFFDPDGEPLIFSVAGLPAGLTIDPVSGLISGIALSDSSQGGPDGNGVYPVTVTVADPDGASRSVNFVLTMGNLPPIAMDDKATALPNLPIEISVLPTDRDPDGDILSVIAASSDNGLVTIMPNGKVQFTPMRGFVGEAVIVYTISDGNGGTATARVTVNVLPEDNYNGAVNYNPWPDDRRQRNVFEPSQQGLSVLAAAKSGMVGDGTIALSADRGDAGDLFRAFLDLSSDSTRTVDNAFPTRAFLGASVGLSLAEGQSGNALWVETMFHEGRFVLKVFEKALDGKIKFARHTLHSDADIRWLQEMSIDLHTGLPPATLEAVEIEVEAMLSGGEVVQRRMIVEPRLGQVRAVQEIERVD